MIEKQGKSGKKDRKKGKVLERPGARKLKKLMSVTSTVSKA